MNISEMLKSWRWWNEYTLKEASAKIGIPLATLQRIEKGKPMDGKTLQAVLRWVLS